MRRAPRRACSPSRSGTSDERRLFLARDRVGDQAALLHVDARPASCSPPRSRRCSRIPTSRADVEPRCRLSLPVVPDDAGAADDVPRHLQAAGRAAAAFVEPDGSSRPSVYWDALPGRATIRRAREAQRQGARATTPCGARSSCSTRRREADDVGRSVRRVPLGRHRLLDERALMSKLMDRPVDTFTVGFSRPRASERARLGAPRSRTQLRHQPPRGADRREGDARLPAEAHPLAGRADRRLGLHPALLRLEARARQRHDRRPGRRGQRRAVLRATQPTWPTSTCTAATGGRSRGCRGRRAGAAAAMARGLFGRHRTARQLPRHRRPRRPRPRAVLERRDGVPGVAQGAARGPEPPRAARAPAEIARPRACCRRPSASPTATTSCARSSTASTSAGARHRRARPA